MFQKERSIFWEVTVLIILRNKFYKYMYAILNGFQDRDILLYSSKLLARVRYYVLFLIPVFIVEETKLVQFT
jgi:hypothetical protein